jgi:hypothetical protein
MFESTADRYDRMHAEREQRAEERGREQGVVASLRKVYEARFGAWPKRVAAAVSAMHDPEVLESWLILTATGSAEDVGAAIRTASPERRAKAPVRASRG